MTTKLPPRNAPLTPAQWALFLSCRNMLKKATARLIYKGCTYEEAYDLCVDALMRAAQTFDPARGLKFSTLAYPSLFRLTAMRKNQRLKKAAKHGGTWSFDEFDGFPEAFVAPDPDDDARRQAIVERFAAVQQAMDILTADERETIQARIIGVTMEQLGEWRGVTKEAIRCQEKRGLAKLRRFLRSPAGMSVAHATSLKARKREA